MAYTTINKSTDYFNTKLYTGNGSDNNAITGVGFQPDMVWLKNRSTTNSHYLQDAVRTATKNLKVDGSDAEETRTGSLKSFDSDGFTLGTETAINGNGNNLVSWNWKANGAGSSNSDGSITSTVSANTTAGFSIVSWTGNNTNGATVGHGLGTAPSVVFFKNRGSVNSWHVYHKSLSTPQTSLLLLDTNGATYTSNNYMSGTVPSSSLLYLGNSGATNENGVNFIAYCFVEKTGYSKFGKFIGNGSTDGTFIYTGFKPSFVIAKESSSTGHWRMRDDKRMTAGNPIDKLLRPDQSNAEQTEDNVDFLSNGFKMRTTGGENNGSGDTYIYMAFGQSLVGSNNVPATAR